MKAFYLLLLFCSLFLGCSKTSDDPGNSLETLPTVTTATISSITSTTATSGGNITSTGGGTVNPRGVCWSTSPNPVISNSVSFDGSGPGAYSSSMPGLLPSTVYYVRAYATNSAGTSYGNEISFTTSAPTVGLPQVTTAAVTSVTPTTAMCGGVVISESGSGVTARGVCWSTSPNSLVSGPHSTNGAGTGLFLSQMVNLNPGTTYFARAYATNSIGTAYGEEFSFPTSSGMDVYVVGHENNGNVDVAKVWKNGVAIALSNGDFNVSAYSVFVNGNDVYAAGRGGGPYLYAKAWKNGAESNLSNVTNGSSAYGVFVKGADTYYAGFITNPQSQTIPTLWKNGIPTSFTSAAYTSGGLNSVYVWGTDVYAAGDAYNSTGVYATVWKNGIPTLFSSPTSNSESRAHSVCVSGSDVYVAGYQTNGTYPVATIWKNGIGTALMGGVTVSTANSVFVSGSDVYVTGSENTNGPYTTAILWKNGVPATLTDGSNPASGESVYVVGNDVYVAGYEYFPGSNLKRVAKLWKNGVPTSLTNGNFDGVARSVFVK